jgi:hypothetical protein
MRASWTSWVAVLLATSASATEWQIPQEQCHGLWIVPLTVENITLQMILDTGASETAIDPDALVRIGGKRRKAGKHAVLKNAALGPMPLERLEVTVNEVDHIAQALGRPIDGVLGFDTFYALLLTLDYPAHEIRVSDGALSAVDDVQIFEDVGGYRPFIDVTLDGTEVRMLLDSGSTGGLDLKDTDTVSWETEPTLISEVVRFDEIGRQYSGRMRGEPMTPFADGSGISRTHQSAVLGNRRAPRATSGGRLDWNHPNAPSHRRLGEWIVDEVFGGARWQAVEDGERRAGDVVNGLADKDRSNQTTRGRVRQGGTDDA